MANQAIEHFRPQRPIYSDDLYTDWSLPPAVHSAELETAPSGLEAAQTAAPSQASESPDDAEISSPPTLAPTCLPVLSAPPDVASALSDGAPTAQRSWVASLKQARVLPTLTWPTWPTVAWPKIPTPPPDTLAGRLTHQLGRGAKALGAPLVWVGVTAFCAGTGYAAYSWLSTIPSAPDCDRLWFFTPNADKLFCFEQKARSGDQQAAFAGLDLIRDWANTHPLHKPAARLNQDWSKITLAIAKQKALDNQLDEAVAVANKIPASSPLYKEAQKAITSWQTNRQKVVALEASVETALKSQDWPTAEKQIQPWAASGDGYQQQQFHRLMERIMTERIAANQLQQLRELINAAPGDAVVLGQAVKLASQIDPNRYSWKTAQAEVNRWSKALATLAATRLAQGDEAGAIVAAERLPQSVSLLPEVRDLLEWHRAQQLDQRLAIATDASETASDPFASPFATEASAATTGPRYPWEQPNWPNQYWHLTATLATLQQVPSTSRVYDRVQALLPRLNSRLQDLNQLRLAQALADVQQIPSLQLAIQVAQGIAPNRPYRLYAQTLIAQWRNDIQRVEDRPILVAAQTRASLGKIPDFKAAIAQASKIRLGRALRPAAQAAIFDWQQQIQTIEDKPFLVQARQFAQQKKLPEAIQAASQVKPGRALYTEAQDAVQTWTTVVQTAEDQPILQQAHALAEQGNLGAALDLAYQIAPGRALYREAQGSIAQWNAQLAATRRRADRATNRTTPGDAPPAPSNGDPEPPIDPNNFPPR
jgi:hypothetical protein